MGELRAKVEILNKSHIVVHVPFVSDELIWSVQLLYCDTCTAADTPEWIHIVTPHSIHNVVRITNEFNLLYGIS